MAKTRKNMKKIQAKSKQKMDKLTGLFACGCVAELILFVVHQLYTQGTGVQMMNMAHVLAAMPLVGIALLVTGVVIRRGEMERIRPWGVCVAGLGAFLALLGPLCLKVNSGAAGMLAVVVPVALLLAVVYNLYAGEFFWLALSMSSSIGALWYWNRCSSIAYLRISALVLMALALVVAVAALVLTVRAMKNNGVVVIRGTKLHVLENCGSKTALMIGHGISVAALVVALVSGGLSVYCLMALGVALFVAAIYYTVTAL